MSDPNQPEQLLSLATFQAPGFDVATLVASLTEDLIRDDKANQGGFDPAPFLTSLENAIQQLIPLRKQVAQQAQSLDKEVGQKERQYRTKVEEIKTGFENVGQQFSGLDSKISEVGKIAIRVGEQLESIDRLRSRASEAHDIILYYNEFSKGDTTRLEALRKEGKEGRAKVAVIARRLLAVAREVDGVEEGDQTRATIEKYAERFEKDMLRLFERAYLKGEPKAMAHCAATLLEFNGGNSCVQIYVNQHDFFISRDRIEAASAVVDTPLWETLPDPNRPSPKTEPELQRLYADIRAQISQEAQIIEAVFPQPAYVMQVFLQRVFAQVVQGHVEQLLAAAQGSSTLAFLRVLALARANTFQLVEDLKGHEFFRSSGGGNSPTSFDASSVTATTPISVDLKSSISAQGAGQQPIANAGVAAVSIMLEQQLDELFGQHLESNRYLDKESKSLTELYASFLLKFANWHRVANKAKPTNTIFDRVVNQLTTAASQAGAGTSAASSSGTQASGLKSLLKLSGISKDHLDADDSSQLEDFTEDGDGDLDLKVAEKMLMWHAEAVGRMIELSSAADVPKNIFILLRALSDSFCKAYVETSLETAISQLASYDPKSEPDLAPLTVIGTVDMIMHLWQRYIATAIVPLAASSVTTRREMSIFNNHILLRIEGKVNQVVQKAMDCILSWLVVCLGKQKKLDYKPKNDELAFAQTNTEPCVLASNFLAGIADVIRTSLSGGNAEVLLMEIGVTFHSLLLDHLKKFPVSATGGLMLTKDLAMYQDTISLYKLPTLNDRFEMLRQLGNVFIVQPSILKSYMAEAYLGRIDAQLLRPFLMMRSDYGDFSRRYWDDICVH